jgi:CHAD domain-containing protein
MELERSHVRKPIRQLRKSLKGLPSNPPMQDVHNLRSRTRNVEALAAAFMPGEKKRKRKFLKALKPVLKVAGEVRDMDVLAAKAHSLAGRWHDDSATRLLAHLQEMRIESANELMKTVARQRKEACRSLKRLSKQIEERLRARNPEPSGGPTGIAPQDGAAARLIDELSRWPALNAENLHTFRIKVKELRNVLRLAGDANSKFVTVLEEVKEAIGDWHDWHRLREIANKVLDADEKSAVVKKIVETESDRFKQALAATYAMRRQYLGGCGGFTIAEQ